MIVAHSKTKKKYFICPEKIPLFAGNELVFQMIKVPILSPKKINFLKN